MEEKYYFIRLVDYGESGYVTTKCNQMRMMPRYFAKRFKLSDLKYRSVKAYLDGHEYELIDASKPERGFHTLYKDREYHLYY